MELNELPTEVLSLILGQLIELKSSGRGDPIEDKRALAKARFVCRKWNPLAAEHLFQTVALKHLPSSRARHGNSSSNSDENEKDHDFTKWESLMDADIIRQSARRVIINSCRDESDNWEIWHDWKENGGYPRFYHAINRIIELPNMNSVNIHFSEHCLGRQSLERGHHSEFDVEPKVTRQMTLSAVFDAIRRRAEDKSATTIRSLAIENLQNTTVLGLDWEAAARDIKELHLLVTEEYNEHGPGYDIYVEERRTFEPHLQRSILPHFADNLTVLTLGFQECWGTMPGYFDGNGLAFPRLKTLNLINFVISHHDHFDWVLNQSSLETLRLESCLIISHIHIDTEAKTLWGMPTHDWEQYPEGAFDFTADDDLVYHFPGTWETVFDQIGAKLPRLTQFKFDSGRGSRFLHPEVIGARLYSDRYIAFDFGLLPSPWLGAEADGEMEFGNNDPTPVDDSDSEYGNSEYSNPEDSDMSEVSLNRAKETELGDTRAFEELLATVSARRYQSS